MTIKPGAFRFNTDSMKLEIFRGSANYEGTASMAGIGTLAAGQWEEIQATSPEVQTGGTRMVMGGGLNPGAGADHILYINASSTGTSQNFGDFAAGSITHSMQSGSSRTRGIFAGGYRNNIEFITIASTGNGTDFGDLINHSSNTSQAYCSNSTRMLTMGGYNYTAPAWAGTNAITKIEINHLGNNQDFGDMTVVDWFQAAAASPTRAVCYGGKTGSTGLNTIDFCTIMTLGNYIDFGDSVATNVGRCGLSNGHGGL